MIEFYWVYPLIFSLVITIHNFEEALWLPRWSIDAGKYYRPVGKKEFRFAVFSISVIAYMLSTLVIIFGFNTLAGKLLIGLMGAMFLNAIFPHLVMTILMKRYAPGVISGIFINVPIIGMMIYKLNESEVINIRELISFTLPMSAILLLIIRPLFLIGRKLFGTEEQ